MFTAVASPSQQPLNFGQIRPCQKNLLRAKRWQSHTANTEEHLDAELVRQHASIADDQCDDPKITLSMRCVSRVC